MTSPPKIGVRRLAHGEGLPLPAYQSAGAAGADLFAAVTEGDGVTLAPGARTLVPTGLALELPEDHEAQVRPRSGLALKHGVTVLNAPGTIDADYRGEIGVLLINHGSAPYTITRGARIAQLVVTPVVQVTFEARDALRSTARAHGGFGSTGIAAGEAKS